MNKLSRFERLRLIEETRKKKQQKINPSGTTGSSSLNNTKISLDDLQPALDDITDSLPIPLESVKSWELSRKTKAANRDSLGENMHDSDTDSDNDDAEEDEAACKSYKNDFGFDEVVDAVLEEKNKEEDSHEEQKLEEVANKKKKTERDATEHERTIEVINVHIKTSKKILLTLFKKFGKVESIRYRNIPVEHADKFRINQIMKNTLDKKRSSMTAFVKFANAEAAKSALAASTTEVSGHHIIVRSCVRQTPHQQREELSKGCTVFVGNLPHFTEEESVYKHFESCGPIVNISIMRNQLKATGTAFLAFKTKEAAAAALKLNDSELQRRTIRVTKAVRKVKANKKHVQSSTGTNTRSPSGGNGNKLGERPFPGNGGANKPFTPNKQSPFQRAPGTGAKGPHNGAVRPGSVHSRLSRPGQQQGGTATASASSGAFTGNKFDQSQQGAVQRLKKKRTKEEVRKIMLAKKLTFKKPAK